MTRVLPLPEVGTVTVRRRVKIHNANEYFNGDSNFGIFAEGDFVFTWERGFDESEYESSGDDLMF